MKLGKSSIVLFAVAALAFGAPTLSRAAPIVTLHAANAGIGSMVFGVVGTTITITETWTSSAPGILQISGLDVGVDYTVVKEITNNSGEAWTRIANELLDPAGQPEDGDDPQPYPAFVPVGFSTSNDGDGLSFAQGSGLPRTASAFTSILVDELADTRDFIDFFTGTVNSGGAFSMTYGLRDNASNQPFLLMQRPNAESRNPVPEPATLLLLGSGLVAAARRRRAANR